MRDARLITPDTAYIYVIYYLDENRKRLESYKAAATLEDAIRKFREEKGASPILVEVQDRTASA